MADATVPVLRKGRDCFTLLDLIRKAAAKKGLVLQEGASRPCSEPIASYVLNDALLAFLAERRIERQDRPDCQNKIFTLIDENPQRPSPGFRASNYWNFQLITELPEGRRDRFDLRVTLAVGFAVNIEKRGVTLWPQAYGTGVSASDHLPNFRMFKALVESGAKEILPVAREIAASEGNILVSWHDLRLGGIRKLSELFAEFAKGNKTVERLGREGGLFDPLPYPRHQQLADELFVAEPAQPGVITAWREQLASYRAVLTI